MAILILLGVFLLACVVACVVVRWALGVPSHWWKYLAAPGLLLLVLVLRIRRRLEARRVWRMRKAAREELAMSNRVGPMPVAGRAWPR